MPKGSSWIFCIAVALLDAGALRAETLIFQEGTLLPGGGAYAAARDTRLEAANPSSSFGSALSVRSDLESFGAEAQGLLRFDQLFGVAPDRIPHGSTITSAVLTLGIFNASNTPVGIISVYRMIAAWNQNSSWNSLVNGVAVGTDALAIADDAHTIETLGPATFDVLPSVQGWAQGAPNRGWVFLNDSTDGVEFWSSEYADDPALRPKLTVTFTPPPVPAVPALSRSGLAALLIGIAITGLCLTRSRARGRQT